ncbi:ParA family protein [Sporosarcina sp. YIM B06819]|uniref:ParA family protein n=1 Tax=Sporosarcina sp. YIM B06819 TaxID=3081769 RepID=UPI00298C4639|nr:ParA family protein [Sporosarcina sp. YIM B06819]
MIVILNALYKGGIGKTTQNVILTNQLAERGYRVLFIDFDPQMSGTRYLSKKSTEDALFQQKNIFEAVKMDDLEANILNLKENIDYVAGNEFINLFESTLEGKDISVDKRHLYFKSLLYPIYKKGLYDFVIMDMSPTKSAMNIAVMTTATHHIVNTQSEVLSIEMIQKYIDDIIELQTRHDVQSEILGISLGMRDRTKLSRHAVTLVQQYFGELVFKTITKRKSRISEYAATGYPEKNNRGLYNVRDSEALAQHRLLTDEILTRLQLPIAKRRWTK